MGLSRRHGLLAVAAGFVAWGLAVKWLPVLRYVGYAFAAGVASSLVALAALVLLTARDTVDRQAKPPTSAGTSIAFLDNGKWEADSKIYQKSGDYRPAYLYPQSFIVSAAVDDLLQRILQEFISSWYTNISQNRRFVNEVDSGIRTAAIHLRDKLLNEDIVELLVSRIVPIITAHFKDFDQAERAVRGKHLTRGVTDSEELDIAIASRYREGNLHPATFASLSDKSHAQQSHLRQIVVSLLPQLLPTNLTKSRASSVLIREVVACGVLFPLMEIFADPDTWNQLMEAYGSAALHERKTVRKLRAALDEHTATAPKSRRGQSFPKLGPNSTERDFERFVRTIRRCNNLSDARRFRNHVTSQLKRENTIEGQDQVYLRRLETGKRVLDQKVARLSALSGVGTSQLNAPEANSSHLASKPHEPSLVDVMHSAAGLSYFMEYMDRLQLMSLVQFWIVVDGFRNPLEDDFGDDTASKSVTWTTADRNDMLLISENHLSKPELGVSSESQKLVKDFLAAGKKATPEQYRKARTVILTSQSTVLDEMQNKYFPGFKDSDLYYKYLASDETAASSSQTLERPAINRSPASDGHDPERHPSSSVSADQPLSHPPQKQKELRRSAKSTTDIFSKTDTAPLSAEPGNIRRSADSDRPPLFDDSLEPDPLEHSNPGIGPNSAQGGETDARVMESMEAALNDIITNQPAESSRPEDSKSALLSPPATDADSARSSLDLFRSDATSHSGDKTKPSISSLGLVNTSSRIGVFSDNDLFPDEKKFIEDEYADPDEQGAEREPEEEIHEAAPGDLGLTEAISALTADIEKLMSQEAVVDALTRKGELTNNTAELRILKKSKASLDREIRRKEMQRQQYMMQESDSSLYGRATIKINSIMVGKEEDGREYALYVIEVQRKAGEQMPAASWAVPRRYSEFHELNQQLRMAYPSVRNLEFPRRRMVMKLQKDFLHKRRLALEAYLQQLLLLPEVCRSRELRSFLSQRAIMPTTGTQQENDSKDKDLVSRIYSSVADGMDDFLGNIAVLDQLSTAGQNLISAATHQLTPTQPELGTDDSVTAAEAEAELNAFEDRELEPFVKPICDIFLEVFDLNKGNNWLRGRAVVVVLHQLLGGTIERKIRENTKSLVDDDSLVRYVTLIKDTMWPASLGGRLRGRRVRTQSEKMKSRTEASVMLATLIPDLAASVVGRANAQRAARRIFATLNNPQLNLHLAYTILDEIVLVLFGGG